MGPRDREERDASLENSLAKRMRLADDTAGGAGGAGAAGGAEVREQRGGENSSGAQKRRRHPDTECTGRDCTVVSENIYLENVPAPVSASPLIYC